MDYNRCTTTAGRTRHLRSLLLAVAAIGGTAGLSVAGLTLDGPADKSTVRPTLDPTACADCTAEAAAYAAALHDLQMAQDNADEAYDDLAECMGIPSPGPGVATHSILEN